MLSYGFSAPQFMPSVLFDARWHSSFQDCASITLIQEFNDSWDGKTNLGGEKKCFSILGSRRSALSVASTQSLECDTYRISPTMQYSLTLEPADWLVSKTHLCTVTDIRSSWNETWGFSEYGTEEMSLGRNKIKIGPVSSLFNHTPQPDAGII